MQDKKIQKKENDNRKKIKTAGTEGSISTTINIEPM